MPHFMGIEYRGLKRGELKKIKADGFSWDDQIKAETPEEVDRITDAFLAVAAPDATEAILDSWPPGDIRDLMNRIFSLTFLPADKRKNFETPPTANSPVSAATVPNA